MLKLQLINSELTLRSINNSFVLFGSERIVLTKDTIRVTNVDTTSNSSLTIKHFKDKIEVIFDTSKQELEELGNVYSEFLLYLKELASEEKENVIIIKASNISLLSLLNL